MSSRLGRASRAASVVYVVLLVAVPLGALVVAGSRDGLTELVARATTPEARAALWLTLWTALVVGVLNLFLGTATAWVLVRERFPGRALLSAVVDLPLAIPTLVAGVMIAMLLGPQSVLGRSLSGTGIEVLHAPPAILLALLFVTFPFVVRSVEPVLATIDRAEEEAALVLGAGPFRTFRTVFLPAILPAALSGGVRSVGRAMGEFGSIVVVAGNIPLETLTAPVFIFGEIESGAPATAAAVSIVLLAFALFLHAVAQRLERATGAHVHR